MWELILILNHIIIIPLSFARFDSLVYVFVYNTWEFYSNDAQTNSNLPDIHTVDMSNLLHRIKQSISFNQSVNHAGLKYNTK